MGVLKIYTEDRTEHKKSINMEIFIFAQVATAPEIPQLSHPSMEPELAIVVVETGKVKKEITKATLARTQQTSAKKKPAKKKPAKKKAAKKPKKKKAKKKKEKKKVVKYPGGKRPKGVHKSKAMIAAGKKTAAAQKIRAPGSSPSRRCPPTSPRSAARTRWPASSAGSSSRFNNFASRPSLKARCSVLGL